MLANAPVVMMATAARARRGYWQPVRCKSTAVHGRAATALILAATVGALTLWGSSSSGSSCKQVRNASLSCVHAQLNSHARIRPGRSS